MAIARRLSGPESNVPWLRIDRAIAELAGLDMQANDSEGASFRSDLRAYLAGRQQQAAEILEELG